MSPWSESTDDAGVPDEPTHDIDALLVDLDDEDPTVRTLAAKVFGRLIDPPPRVVQALTLRLGDPDPMVRSMAAASLGRHGALARGAAPALAPLLDDAVLPVRFWAADALARIGTDDPNIRAALERVAQDPHPMAKASRAAARRALSVSLDDDGAEAGA